MRLTAVQQKFILHWGEMGERWGINRTVAQIHALLYVNPKPLPAEEIARTLSVARSNVSTSLRELHAWGVIRTVQFLGDRRDHFESVKDVWEMFWIVMDERKRRELDPTVQVLRQCVEQTPGGKTTDVYTHERLAEMLEFVKTMSAFYEQVRRLPAPVSRSLFKGGSTLRKLLGGGG